MYSIGGVGGILQTNVTAIADSVNALWILVASILVFFMQPGFALLEAGQVRAKNAANVTMKNIIDWSIGVVVYFVLGFGLASLVGMVTSPVYGVSVSESFVYIGDSNSWILWLFGAVFAMTAATIISGAVSGRMRFGAYIALVFVVVGVLYPVAQGLAWEGGLLTADGYLGNWLGVAYLDFAGATVVHMVGGVAGLTAAWVLGPRRDRFDDSGSPQHLPGHSVIYVMLGAFILAFGWYGFNVGTQSTVLSAADGGTFNGAALGRVAVVTTLGMGAGALSSAAVTYRLGGGANPTFTANGMLAGLVAITGAAIHVSWWGGIILGALGGASAYPVFYLVLTRLKVDDVCGVFSVHGFAGALGTVLIPFFAVENGTWSPMGLEQVVMQVLGVSILGVWAAGTTLVAMRGIQQVMPLRVSAEAEKQGLDRAEHNTKTYRITETD